MLCTNERLETEKSSRVVAKVSVLVAESESVEVDEIEADAFYFLRWELVLLYSRTSICILRLRS